MNKGLLGIVGVLVLVIAGLGVYVGHLHRELARGRCRG